MQTSFEMIKIFVIHIRVISESKLSVRRNNAAAVRICSILVMILGLVSIVTVFGVPGCIYNLTALHVLIEKTHFRNIALSTLDAESFCLFVFKS